jgi:hypothetical protein
MPQAFDFLIDGELLRTPVEQFLLTKEITAVSLSAVVSKCWSHCPGFTFFFSRGPNLPDISFGITASCEIITSCF